MRFDPLKPNWDAADKVVKAFDRQGIRIAAVFGYTNVVDPDPVKRKRAEERLTVLLTNWKRLGCSNISTETGTLNAQSEWADSPENYTEAGYLQCRTAMERLARTAEKAQAVLSIEPYWRNVINGIDRAARLFHDVQSPSLRLVMDPCNYYRKADLSRMDSMLEEMFCRLGDRIVIAHAKDVKAAAGDGTDLPAAGLGVLDYPLYLRLLTHLDREIDLMVEHLEMSDAVRARDFVLGEMAKL